MPTELTLMRNNEDLRISISIPPFFRCPISLELMADPVSLCTGVTYDRTSIEKWLDDGNSICPATMQTLENQDLIPNHTLRRLIQEWCVAKGVVRIPTPKPVAEPANVSQIIQGILDENTCNKLEALKSLKSLAMASERNRKCMKSVGVFPVLIQVVMGSNPQEDDLDLESQDHFQVLQEAVGALSWFSFDDNDDESTRRLLTTPPVIRTLALLLAKGNPDARMNAAALIAKLAYDRASAREIGSVDGITEGLLKLFEAENLYPAAIKASLKALLPLCAVVKNRAKIAEVGAVPGLIELLPGADRGTTEQCLAILEALSTTSKGRSAIVGHALAVQAIVRSLLVVSEIATDYAVGILLSICFNSAEEELLIEVLQMGTFERLLMVLQIDCSPRTKHKANELLRLLSPMREQDRPCPSGLEF
eukprot:Gb_13090 [translate_table: standard]